MNSIFSLLCLDVVSSIFGFQLNIIEVIIGQNPLYGYPVSAPVFDVTFEQLELLYPELMKSHTRKRIYKPEIASCADAAALAITTVLPEVMKYIKNLSGFNLLISPELGFPVFSSTGSTPNLANKARFPTTLGYGILDYESMALSVKAFIDKFAWKTVMLLCDSASQYPVTNGYYSSHCLTTKRVLPVSGGQYDVKLINFDSANIQKFDSILEGVRKQSRVVLVFTHPSILRHILINAAHYNMTNGNYVYLAPIPTIIPTFGSTNLTWQYQDSDDATAFEAFRSLITYTSPNPNYEAITSLSEARRRTSVEKYNITFGNEELYNDFAISAYETVTTMIQVLNESYLNLDLTATSFCRLFMNRTFTLPSRTWYMSSSGLRVSDVEYYRLNETTGKMKEIWHYYSRERKLKQISMESNLWRGGKPPLDIPVCGFQNDRCYSSNFPTILGIAVACVAGLFITLFAVGKIVGDETNSTWWWLNDNDQSNANEDKIALESTDQHSVSINITRYNGTPVWIESVPSSCTKDHLVSSRQVKKWFSTIRQIRHLNISVFHGIFLLKNRLKIVYEKYERGTLRNFLDADDHFNASLQRSIIWDLLDGIHYIHTTSLGCHGKLSPFCVFLDKRFTIKICGYATAALSFLLTGKHGTSVEGPQIAYLAPELTNGQSSVPTKAGDIYSVSVVSLEVIERIAGSIESDLKCKEIFKLGRALNLSDRPSAKQLMMYLQSVLPRKNMVDGMMQTLKKYAENLEDLVAERTASLLAEREISDELLRTMIPSEFVNALRNKQTVAAEQFECITVMFSDLPQFGTICARSTPLEVTALLNAVYVSLDYLIDSFDVYKVETINDSYMVASGLPVRNGNQHAGQIALLALEFIKAFNSTEMASELTDKFLKPRIGFHSGPCAAGIVGLRMPRYCLFGDTINTASRMETNGEVSRIHLSYESKTLLDKLRGFVVEFRGEIFIKGKGTKSTFWLIKSEPQGYGSKSTL